VEEPGTIWLNTYHGGSSQGEYRFAPSNYSKTTGRDGVSKMYRTYTIDWQPTHVAWYLDGFLLARDDKSAAFEPPSRPLYFLASIWSDAARNFQFGGRLDYGQSPFTSSLSKVLQISCKAGAGRNGPSWTLTEDQAAAAAAAAPPPDAGTTILEAGAASSAAADDVFASLEGGLEAADGGAAGNAPPKGYAKGVYLGCYDSAVLQMGFSEAMRMTAATAYTCIEQCRALNAPVYSVSRSFQCLCLADAPHPAAALPDNTCDQLEETSASSAVPIFYVHTKKDETCSVSHTEVNWGNFEALSGRDSALFDESSDSLTLKMEGQEGVKLASKRKQQWGMLSFKAQISDKSGVVTAVNVSLTGGFRGGCLGPSIADCRHL